MKPLKPEPTKPSCPGATDANNVGASKAAWPHYAATPAACQLPEHDACAPTRRRHAQVQARQLTRAKQSTPKKGTWWPEAYE